MSKDEFGDRMKLYESAATKKRLDIHKPICVRIDGRSFSKFTSKFDKPFDCLLRVAMQSTCQYLVEKTNARIGYVQSDEISLVYLANEDDEKSSIIFDGRESKLTSVLASMATAHFNMRIIKDLMFKVNFARDCQIVVNPDMVEKLRQVYKVQPHFDARVWNVPSKDEATNTLYWRYLDAKRNAISSIAYTQFSPKQLHGKSDVERREMINEHMKEVFYSDFDLYGSFFKKNWYGEVDLYVDPHFHEITHAERHAFVWGDK